MKFISLSIPDLLLIRPEVFGDHRGFFMETWQAEKFKQAGIDEVFVQDSHSKSSRGILRGLHYQLPRPQGKLVRVIAGEIFDVAVDLRRNSPTFGKWAGERLSAENKLMFWVPAGFAHGFYVLSETAEVIYKCTGFYAQEHERCLHWDDPDLGIDWPLVNGGRPILSGKDAAGISFKEAEYYP